MVLSWCFPDEGDERSEAMLETARTRDLVAPNLLDLEFTNGLLLAERRKRITRSQFEELIDFFNYLSISFVEEEPVGADSQIVKFARAHSLSVYDASYLALAVERKLPLATRDKVLQRAASKCRLPNAQ
jgi:predicted nucleic acid-binding protein